jgi:hypothetical protein
MSEGKRTMLAGKTIDFQALNAKLDLVEQDLAAKVPGGYTQTSTYALLGVSRELLGIVAALAHEMPGVTVILPEGTPEGW